MVLMRDKVPYLMSGSSSSTVSIRCISDTNSPIPFTCGPRGWLGSGAYPLPPRRIFII